MSVTRFKNKYSEMEVRERLDVLQQLEHSTTRIASTGLYNRERMSIFLEVYYQYKYGKKIDV